MQVVVEMVQRVAGKQVGLAVDEQFLQREVDRPHRAMVIDRCGNRSPRTAMNRSRAERPRSWIVSPAR